MPLAFVVFSMSRGAAVCVIGVVVAVVVVVVVVVACFCHFHEKVAYLPRRILGPQKWFLLL